MQNNIFFKLSCIIRNLKNLGSVGTIYLYFDKFN